MVEASERLVADAEAAATPENVDTAINVYTQVLDGSVRDAVERVGSQMNAIERSANNSAGTTTPTTQIA